HHPLRRDERNVKLLGEIVDGDVDDGGVQHWRDRPQHHNHRQHDEAARDSLHLLLLRVCGVCHECPASHASLRYNMYPNTVHTVHYCEIKRKVYPKVAKMWQNEGNV